MCMYCMRQSVWPKPGPRHAARLTRAASSWGASGPVAHVWLRYVHVATPPMRRGRPANALRFTNQPSDHGDHGCLRRVCTKAETSCPDLQARLSYTAQVRVRHAYATLSRALAASVCDVCSGHRPRTRQDGHGYMLVNGSCCAPARLEMHWQSSIQSKVHASGVQTRLLARPGSDLASDPCLSVRMPRGVITQWGPGSSRPRRPCTACLWGSGSLFTSSLYLCRVAALHKSVVRSWRPTCLAR